MYPNIEINLKKLRDNADAVLKLCHDAGVNVAGVIKVCDGDDRCTKVVADAGCDQIASSRLEQLKRAKKNGVKQPLMLIRIPMISEVAEMVTIVDISLNSEIDVIRKIDEEVGKIGKVHKVVLMIELGDLREGIWDKEEIISTALTVENELKNVELHGVGTNLGCYGSIDPSAEKLTELVEIAEMIEEKIGRKLDMISGGGSTSVPRIINGDMPDRINHLRVGEAIMINKDLEDIFGIVIPNTHRDVFTLNAEVIESKVKPTHPIGDIMFDAFRNRPTYEDFGDRKRVLLAVGKVDYGYPEQIYSTDKACKVLGASSDHTIMDVEDSDKEYRVGDIMKMDVLYSTTALLFSASADAMIRKYIG